MWELFHRLELNMSELVQELALDSWGLKSLGLHMRVQSKTVLLVVDKRVVLDRQELMVLLVLNSVVFPLGDRLEFRRVHRLERPVLNRLELV